jgi:DNA-binding transcriptional MerR regulator
MRKESKELRVGELAKRTGLTVRTLHHWDQVGLLSPGGRTPAGHRLYGGSQIRRLQRILSLRAVGLGLDEIRELLEERAPSLDSVLRTHRDRIRQQRSRLGEVEARLDRILDGLAAGRPVDEEELLETMERMTMIEKHYTPEQLEALAERKESLGPEAIQKAEEEWPRLISAVREAMEKGKDPASEDVQLLAKRWSGLVQAFTGGDSGIETSLGNMHKAEPDMAAKQGLDPALFQYIGAAMVAMKRAG